MKHKTILNLILLFSIFALVAAYFIQYVMGHQPCNLCLIERIPFMVTIVIILLTLLFKKFEKVSLIALSLIFFILTLISFYHFGIEQGFVDRDKSHCLDANYFKGGNLKSYFEKHRRQLVFSHDGLCHVGDADLKGHGYNRRVYHIAGKSPSLAAASGGNLEPKILQTPRGNNTGGLRALDGKTPTLSSSAWEHNNHLTHDEGLTWRKLTPLEAERLQTVPEGYTAHVSNTQRYRMLGNGFTTQVIAHMFQAMLCDIDEQYTQEWAAGIRASGGLR